jgi:hypothetical protein
MVDRRTDIAQRLLSGVDLAIDFATLGEYGLEPLNADGSCRERSGARPGWEALATARRGACDRRQGDGWRFPTARLAGTPVDFGAALRRYA